jgi:hypothetical protein
MGVFWDTMACLNSIFVQGIGLTVVLSVGLLAPQSGKIRIAAHVKADLPVLPQGDGFRADLDSCELDWTFAFGVRA